MLQFGCIHVFEETKSGIYAYYGLKRGDKGSPNLSVTPLNFQAFVGDITSRFPNYSMELKDFQSLSTTAILFPVLGNPQI